MNQRSKLTIFFFLFLIFGKIQAQENLSDLIEDRLTEKEASFSFATPTPDEVFDISLEEDSLALAADTSTLEKLKPIQQLYLLRDYQPLWCKQNSLTKADTLLQWIGKATEEGLEPEDYDYTNLKERFEEIDPTMLAMYLVDWDTLVNLEIDLSRAALRYSEDLLLGKVDPFVAQLQWEIPQEEVEMSEDLQLVDTLGVTTYFENLLPKNEHYDLLKKALADFDTLVQKDTGFMAMTKKQKLELGDSSDQVELLRKRLALFYPIPEQETNKIQYTSQVAMTKADTIQIMSEDKERQYIYEVCEDTIYAGTDSMYILKDSTQYSYDSLIVGPKTLIVKRDSFSIQGDTVWDPYYFDSTLLKYLVQFQNEFGLEPDSVVGPKTIAALDRPITDYIDQIKLNLDRWRWLPRDHPPTYIVVNIAGFYLDVFEDDTIALTKKVMVGNVRTKTPVFGDMIQYLELNPYWTVPYSIATREMLPKIKKDPGYLSRNNYKLLKNGKSVDPYSVDWSTIKRSGFPYVIRQNPNKKNALGIVKFMFPNRYNVYLHDTPSKHLFVEYSRAFSHGCIRLEKPVELAEYLLKDNSKWTPQKIEQTLKRGKNKRIDLKTPLPIYLTYFTTWVDKEGTLQFQKDVYRRDKKLLEYWKNPKQEEELK